MLPCDSFGTTCGAKHDASLWKGKKNLQSPPPMPLDQWDGNTNRNLPPQNVPFIASLVLFRYFNDGVNGLGPEKYISMFLVLNTNITIKLYGLLKCKTIKSWTSLGEIWLLYLAPLNHGVLEIPTAVLKEQLFWAHVYLQCKEII